MGLQTEADLLSTTEAERLIFKSRSQYYEEGDKHSKLLASQLGQKAASHFISQIRLSDGSLSEDHQAINNHFKKFYSKLYISDVEFDQHQFDGFLSKLNIPTIDSDTEAKLEWQITQEEIITAIMSLQSGKAPGPDGFPTEFYKKFKGQLAHLLLSVYEEALENKILLPTLHQASIILLLKKDKDPLDCSSYRPISLTNCDSKVFSKVIALRLESALPYLISDDQTGFIQDRQSYFNLRRLFNIIYTKPNTLSPEAIISLDAEKAFDRVEWDCLFHALHRFGFGCKFINLIKLLYNNPTASVHTNSISSDYFSLSRGTKQGDPLSPLLFALAIEPLSIALRSNGSIQGIVRGGLMHTVSLYADNLFLYVTNPTTSMTEALTVLENFGKISGYKLNYNKIEYFSINKTAETYPNLPFKLSVHSFTYLGVKVTKSYYHLFKNNFAPLLEQTKKDIKRWSTLPLSLVGRINSFNQTISPFIWNNKSLA